MPMSDLDKDRWAQSMLMLYLRKFIPTLNDFPTFRSDRETGRTVTTPTIFLHPMEEGSRMPMMKQDYLLRGGGKGGPA